MSKVIIAVAGVAALGAFLFPSVFQTYKDRQAEESRRLEATAEVPAVLEAVQPAATPTYSGRVARLKAEGDGHFRVEARLNGQAIPVLVDTGATYVSINEAMARKLGINLKPEDFRFKARTASGESEVAVATLQRVQIGRVEVRDVEALVSKGNVLPVTLLGMSFLGKLKRYAVEGDTLNLVQ